VSAFRPGRPARCLAGIVTVMMTFLSIAALSPAQAMAAPDPNLLTNGSFEGAGSTPGPTVGWTLTKGNSAAYAGGGVDGGHYADFVATAGGGSMYQDIPVSASAGQAFQASVWIRSSVGTIRPTLALFGNLNGTGRAAAVVTAGTTWRKFTLVMGLKAATRTVRFQVFGVVNAHVNLDDAVLTFQLLANSSFEAASTNPAPTTGWTVRKGRSAAWRGGAQDGAYWADFFPTGTGASIYQDIAVTGELGQTFQATIWYRTTASAGGSATVALFGDLAATGTASTTVTLAPTWRRVSITIALRGRTSTLRLQVYGAVNSHVNLDNALLTPVGPAAQTAPPPISTSRYLRDLTGAAGDATIMRSRGATDASNNPSGHAFLQLLDIGGQDQLDGGVILSATSRFISYQQLLAALKAYVSGYASRQLPGAPALIAIGTNNDMDVSAATGRDWADRVVDPLMAYAAGYSGITIAGANDAEPGFRAGSAVSRAWLSGYLAATTAKFVFNGSADGCSWTAPNATCNNGWRASDLYWLGAGAAPARIITVPQIYNTTMAHQWSMISLTGAATARINFGGPLTEYTACAQAGSCASLVGNAAWGALWSAINANPRTSQPSLPYSTDLRIN